MNVPVTQQSYQQQLEHLAVEGLVNRWLSLPEAAKMSKLSYYELGERVGVYYKCQQEAAA